MSRSILLGLALLLGTLAARAQGGPPFLTDDPETPGNRHFEVNFGFIADHNPGEAAYQIPDFDINYGLGDRIQLKYEIPIAIEEVIPQAAAPGSPAVPGYTLGGIGESLLGVKWRFYEHHPGDPALKGRFGTGLLGLFQHTASSTPAGQSGDSPGQQDAPEQLVDLSIGTYPQLFLDNPTRAVPRGLVAPGPGFFLPIEINGRIGPLRFDLEAGYNFGNRNVPQSWSRGILLGHEFSDSTELYLELHDLQDANRLPQGRGIDPFSTGGPKARETTLGLGGRQALNHAKSRNLLLMAGRSFQSASATNAQPNWIAYVGLQVLFPLPGTKAAR